jgi:hypothetical protein
MKNPNTSGTSPAHQIQSLAPPAKRITAPKTKNSPTPHKIAAQMTHGIRSALWSSWGPLVPFTNSLTLGARSRVLKWVPSEHPFEAPLPMVATGSEPGWRGPSLSHGIFDWAEADPSLETIWGQPDFPINPGFLPVTTINSIEAPREPGPTNFESARAISAHAVSLSASGTSATRSDRISR